MDPTSPQADGRAGRWAVTGAASFRGLLLVACVALASASRPPLMVAAFPSPSTTQATSTMTVDVLVLDRDGRFVENLGPADFTATVDGKPRRVVQVRRVSRGPGALAEAASRQATGDGSISFAAEPRRNVIVVVDQATLGQGDARAVVQAAGMFLDRLGIDDRVAVLHVPTPSDTQVVLTTDRPVTREVLAGVAGKLSSGRTTAPGDLTLPRDPAGMSQPGRETMVQPEGTPTIGREPPVIAPEPAGTPSVDVMAARQSLADLRSLLLALRQIQGRKIVALFTAGIVGADAAQIEDVAASAHAAHAVIYAFGLRSSHGDTGAPPDFAAVETLARGTGGSFAMLGKNLERTIERAVGEFAACYVLEIEAGPLEAGPGRQALRVATPRKGLTVRASSWLMPGLDAGDERPPAPGATVASVAPAASSPTRASETRPAPDPAREARLQLALGRLFEYVSAYERQYSMLVAEEDYRQSYRGGSVRLRSDILLVRPDKIDFWVSFRDVFEVDGRPVRDREDRLKRLFLDPTPEAQARLQAVTDESARYNAGPVVRTINVPLFPLSLVSVQNRQRFDFTLGRQQESMGVPAWRLEFVERTRPTVVRDLADGDMPLTGWFLVDQMTGAVVETRVEARRGASWAEFVVRYRPDPVLGLWVPVEMKEIYTDRRLTVIADGKATYSNFRRFQVRTEEQLAVPK